MHEQVARRTESVPTLLRRAAGSRAELAGKIRRFFALLARYRDRRGLDERLRRLRDQGLIDRIPTRVQLAVGAADMLRFWISPASADYYRKQGIGYGLHQVLRVLEPASMADPIGLLSTEDGIIGHLMQVVHANPVYDLQLLTMFEDGLDHLEQQLEAMLDGTHPRAAGIAAIVEEADYHARLLAFVRRWRKDPKTAPLIRSNIEAGGFGEIEKTFGELPSAMRYFAAMPTTWRGAIAHLRGVKEFRPVG